MTQGAQPIEQHWQELMQALNRLDAEREGGVHWSGQGQGADIGGLSGLLSGHTAALRGQGDSIGLAAAGTELKGFTGLREGASRLNC